MVIQILVSGRYFLENEKSELLLQGKPPVEFTANDEMQAFKNQIFGKCVSATVS